MPLHGAAQVRACCVRIVLFHRHHIVMITTITRFALPHRFTREEARAAFLASTPRFRAVPGLLRKFYLLSDDGLHAGGVYLWQNREAAERMFTPEWHALIRDKYGSEATVSWFDSPVLIDNLAGETLADD